MSRKVTVTEILLLIILDIIMVIFLTGFLKSLYLLEVQNEIATDEILYLAYVSQ